MLSAFVFILFFRGHPDRFSFKSFCAHVIIVKQAPGGEGTVLNNNIVQANRSHRSRSNNEWR